MNMAAGRVLRKTVTAISEALNALDVGEDDISNTWQRGWLFKRSRHFNVSRRVESCIRIDSLCHACASPSAGMISLLNTPLLNTTPFHNAPALYPDT